MPSRMIPALEHFSCRCSAGLLHLWAFSSMKTPLHAPHGIPSNRKNALDIRRRVMGLALIACTWLLFIPYIQSQQFPVRFYANETGLANLAVTAVTQDKKGYLWVGTENGVYRFDGSHFQRFGTEGGLR